MGDNGMGESIGETNDVLERWRRAAADAFQQLDWAIGYLHAIRKTREASALAANRRVIRQNLLERPAEPLPSDPVREAPQPPDSQGSGSSPASKRGGKSSQYEDKTKKELQQQAAKVGIKGELIDALRNH